MGNVTHHMYMSLKIKTMTNNKQSMGDMQFNGTPEEWEALVKKNKMSNNKQSSVEWLEKNLPDLGEYIPLGVSIELHAKFQHAKEMHKKQSFKTFKAGQDSMEEGGKGFEQWYQETFGGNK